MSDLTVGVRPLLRVTLRQDAHSIAPWVVLISVLSASSVLAYPWVFPDEASRDALETAVGANPALSIVFGPARDLMTADGFNAWRAGMLGAFFAGLMAILVVVRNSRAQEDSGQAELLASGVMSRPARLVTAVATALVASVALGVVASVLTIAVGGGVVASITLAATFTASGFMWAGVAAVAAQIGSDSRSASGIAIATLGATYVARGYIDASQASDWAVWLTPFGWLSQVQPGTKDDLRPLVLALALTVVTVGTAFLLQSRRDYGMGLVPPRPGPARGGSVAQPSGLAMRLNRGLVISWTLAFVVLGLVFGNLSASVGEVVAANPSMGNVMASGAVSVQDLTFGFLATILSLAGMIAAVYAVQVVQRVSTEETAGRVDPLLAGALTREAYLATNAVIAFVGPAVALLLGGVVIGLVASASEPTISVGDVVSQTLVTIPAVWSLTALALALVGALPRARLAAWLAIVVSFALTILGPLFNLSDAILGISPFEHVPTVTDAAPDWSGLMWLLLVTLALTTVGFAGFRRRDVM